MAKIRRRHQRIIDRNEIDNIAARSGKFY